MGLQIVIVVSHNNGKGEQTLADAGWVEIDAAESMAGEKSRKC